VLSIAIAGGLPARTEADVTTMTGATTGASWYQDESALAPATVGGRTFGIVASPPVDGQVYAQPLVVGDLVVVATGNDSVYGISALTRTVRWQQSIARPASRRPSLHAAHH